MVNFIVGNGLVPFRCAVPFGHVTEGVKPLPYNCYFPSNTRIIPVVILGRYRGLPLRETISINKTNADGREAHPYGGPNSYGGGLLPPLFTPAAYRILN